MRTGTLLRLSTTGSRPDTLRIVMTALAAAAGLVALLCALTVAVTDTAAGDGPYTSNLLNEQGLHPGVVAALVLLCIPILTFVGQCSRIGAPARDRRLASLRMAGATPRDVTTIAAAESGLAAGVGAAAGLGIYLIGRQLLDRTSAVNGELVRALPTDVLPPWWAVLVLTGSIPVAAAVFSSLALRRVAVTPFGVLRAQRDVPPRVLPVVLLAVGASGMAAFAGLVRLLNLDRQPFAVGSAVFFGLFLLAATGLILGTAAVAAVLGRSLAPRVQRPWLLIASRQMIALPLSASRTSSAVILAVLIGAIVQGVRVNFLLSTDPAETLYADAFDLINLALAVALLIAAAGLMVNAAEGIVSRRRTYAALAASGTPRTVLAKAALAETLLPLLPGVLLAAATGILAARGVFGTEVQPPPPPIIATEATDPSVLAADPALVPVPVPWTELTVLVGGSLGVIALTTALGLLLLRAATNLDELRSAA